MNLESSKQFLLVLTIIILIFGETFGHQGHEHHNETTPNPNDPTWTNNMTLVRKTGVELKWNSSDPEYLIMEMSSKTTGYVAVGFCKNWTGSMAGCDIVLGWVKDDGMGEVFDFHAKSNGAPILDASQDVELLNYSQRDFKTTIQFKRKWNTTDSEEFDANLRDNKVQLIWAWHPIDPELGADKIPKIPPHDKNTRGHTDDPVMLYHDPNKSSAGIIKRNFYLEIFTFIMLTMYTLKVSVF